VGKLQNNYFEDQDGGGMTILKT